MKFLTILALLSVGQAIRHSKPFKLGEDVIDFDEDAEPEAEKVVVQITFDDLAIADESMLKEFNSLLHSAKRNANKGDLNQEMGKA